MGIVVREAFAQWLRGQLRSNGWMVSDFATQVGVRPSAVYRWTAGQRTPTDGQIDKIANTLRVESTVIWNELAREGIMPMAPSAAPGETRAATAVASPVIPVPNPDRPFAKWLRGELEQRGWTAGFLARKIGIDIVTVRAWVGGVRTPASVQFTGIADAFEVPLETVQSVARQ
jgi:transcriptional regulator with XRE-family HTH domain